MAIRSVRGDWPTVSPARPRSSSARSEGFSEAREVPPPVPEISGCGPHSGLRKDDSMKRIMKVWMAIAALILLGASGVSAQSLGDYARAVRKKKPQAETATRQVCGGRRGGGTKEEAWGGEGPPPLRQRQPSHQRATERGRTGNGGR